MRSSTTLGGVLPVLQTPFDADGDLDFATLGAEIDWVLANGCDGVVVAMVSEIMRLSCDERDALNAYVCAHVAGRAQVIVSVGAESDHTVARFAQHADAAGADAVMAIPPVLTRLDDKSLFAYYARLFEVTGLPVVVQDASGYLGAVIPLAVQAELLARFGDRAYFKPEAAPIGPRLGMLMAMTEGRARVFEGSGGIALVDSYRRGAIGTMPAADVCWALRALWDALVSGDEQRVDAISGPLCRLISFQSELDIFVAAEKYLLKQQGIFGNDVMRGPSSFGWDKASIVELEHCYALVKEAVEGGQP